jgi:excisionase family DNA binding protein
MEIAENQRVLTPTLNEKNMAPEPFVDATAVAQFLSIARRQVLELARAGELPAHPIGSGRRRTWRFKLSEVDQMIASGGRRPGCEGPHTPTGDIQYNDSGSPRSRKGRL